MFRYLRNELTADQQQELNEWRQASPENEEFFRRQTDLEKIRDNLKEMNDHKDIVWQKIVARSPEFVAPPVRKINFQIVWGRSHCCGAAHIHLWPCIISSSDSGEKRTRV